MIDFNNTQIAFSSKSDRELKNARLLFKMIGHPFLVKMAKVASHTAIKLHFPISWAVKPTLYKQFVGGETLQECLPTITHLKKYNVKSTLDFSAESEQTAEGIEATFAETIRSIDFAKGNPDLAYTVFKPSTLTTDELLAKASEKREPLTEEEKMEYQKFVDKFFALCQRAYDNQVRIIGGYWWLAKFCPSSSLLIVLNQQLVKSCTMRQNFDGTKMGQNRRKIKPRPLCSEYPYQNTLVPSTKVQICPVKNEQMNLFLSFITHFSIILYHDRFFKVSDTLLHVLPLNNVSLIIVHCSRQMPIIRIGICTLLLSDLIQILRL